MSALEVAFVGDQEAKLSVVLMHGFSMRPEDLLPFGSPFGLNACFWFPRAPLKVQTGGYSWWDVDLERREALRTKGGRDLFDFDPPGLSESRRQIRELLRELRRMNPTAKFVVGGFSQGGMLACDLLMHDPNAADGLVALSASRLDFDHWRKAGPKLGGMPTLVAHGRGDEDVSFAAGQHLATWLESIGAAVNWVPFDGGHEIPLHVWRALHRFLRRFSS